MNTWIYRWLFLIALLHIAAGLAVSFFITFDQSNSYLQYLFNQFNIADTNSSHPSLQLITTLLKLFGPVIIGWGLLFFAIIYLMRFTQLTQQQFHIMKIAGLSSTIIWYGLDALLAWQVSLSVHILFNGCIILALVLPFALLKYEISSDDPNAIIDRQ